MCLMKTVCFVNPRLPMIVVAKGSKTPKVEGSSKYCFVRDTVNQMRVIFSVSCDMLFDTCL